MTDIHKNEQIFEIRWSGAYERETVAPWELNIFSKRVEGRGRVILHNQIRSRVATYK